MKKKTKKTISVIIIGAIIIFLIWKFGFNLFAITPIQNTQFVSYTAEPRSGYYCDIEDWWSNYDLTTSTEPVISTLLSSFKFKTTTAISQPIYSCKSLSSYTKETGIDFNAPSVVYTYVDDFGCQHWSFDDSYKFVSDYGGAYISSHSSGCFYSVEVYKDGILIDKINQTGGLLQKSYSDSGNVYEGDLPTSESGIKVDFGDQSFYTSRCTDSLKCQVMHSYRIYVPKEKINIEIDSPKEEYLEGEDVDIDVNVISGYNDLFGRLFVTYEVPTILGAKQKIDTYDNLKINKGNNIFSYKIPTVRDTDILKITPKIDIYDLTSKSSGINVINGFEEFGVERARIDKFPKIKVYSITEDTKSIKVLPSLRACNLDSDCTSPCEGITMKCLNNKCVSSGECEIPEYEISEQTLSELLKKVWSKFVEWLNTLF